jgi:enoyl-CoA hydratase/carnithine racemase
MSDLLYEVRDQVALLTLNRPERLNAFSDPMLARWAEALEEADRDPAVRVIVVTGAGRGFCSGADVKAEGGLISGGTPIERRHGLREGPQRVARTVRSLDKPYLAAVNGVAAGAGMDMASMADMRFAAASARFIMAYVRVALVPGDGGCYYLPRIVGMARALDLMWTGRELRAEEAKEIGYVSEVYPDDQLLPEVMRYAQTLAAGPAVSIEQIRHLAYRSQEVGLDAALEMAQAAMHLVRLTEDAAEGRAAFREKRSPRFQGR